jgi:hypothetical protein
MESEEEEEEEEEKEESGEEGEGEGGETEELLAEDDRLRLQTPFLDRSSGGLVCNWREGMNLSNPSTQRLAALLVSEAPPVIG